MATDGTGFFPKIRILHPVSRLQAKFGAKDPWRPKSSIRENAY
jgi:hypothetical protein